MWISCLEWSSILIDDANGLWLASETKHIVAELHDTWRDARLIALWETDVIDCLVVLTIALELATKDSAEIHVVGAVVILEDGIVNRIAALDGMWLGDEWAFGLVADGDTATEDASLVLGREIHVVFAILLLDIAVPKLLFGPRNLLTGKDNAFVLHLTCHWVAGDRKHMIILHVEVNAPVILGDARIIVVRWVDVNLTVKDMHRWVGHVILREKVSFHDLVMSL